MVHRSAKGSITLYSGQHEQTTDSLIAGFEKLTGITVNVRFNDEDTFADEIVTEGKKSPADVFFTENSPVLEYLQDKHLLASLPASTLARTPSKFNSPQGDWVGVSARVSVLIYNPKLIAKSNCRRRFSSWPIPSTPVNSPSHPAKPTCNQSSRRYFAPTGTRGRWTWLDGIKSNSSGHIYARQRDHRR